MAATTLQNSTNTASAAITNYAARQLIRTGRATVITPGVTSFDVVRLLNAAQDTLFTNPGRNIGPDDILFRLHLIRTPGT